jgi:hypothetical protein
MRRLIIIGNGFDLAHGLKTSYSDFLFWYYNNAFKQVYEESNSCYNDDLVEITCNGKAKNTVHFTSEAEMQANIKSNNLNLKYISSFLRDLSKEFSLYRWVDIEYYYYSKLLALYKRLEKKGLDKNPTILSELKKLNYEFEQIKENLQLYLLGLEINNKLKNSNIEEYFSLSHRNENEVLVLNFNYTSTPELYYSSSIIDTINIHGTIDKQSNNPIVFGYGDEMDMFYEKMERLNENEFLKNIKSFGYFKTKNYQNALAYLDKNSYNVDILGHSCGISDRILLNSIFEHENCNHIRIFYHRREDGSNDYFEKTQEISRHFKPNNKGKMRTKVVSFEDCKPLIH